MLILNIDAWRRYINKINNETVLDDCDCIYNIFMGFNSCFTWNDNKSKELLDFICTEIPDVLSNKLDYRNEMYDQEVKNLKDFVNFLLNKEVNRILVHPLYAVMNNNLEEKQNSSCMFTIENLADIERIDVGNYQYLHDVELIDLISYAGIYHYISDDAMGQYHKSLTMDTLTLVSSVMTGKLSGKDIKNENDIPLVPQTMLKLDIPGRDAIVKHLKEIISNDALYTNSLRSVIELINPNKIEDFGNCNRFMTNYLYNYYSLYYRVIRGVVTKVRGFKQQEKCLLKLIDYTRTVYINSSYHSLAGMMMRFCVGVTFCLGIDQPYMRSTKLKPYLELLKSYKGTDMAYESTDILGAILLCKETQSTMLDEVNDIKYFHKIVSEVINDKLVEEDLEESLETVLMEMETPSHLMTTLTETFEVLRDGTIKVTLPERTTFMNEYAVNHRLLKYNEQRKDYNGMKYNLVYHMILIENIEKEVLYNPKVKKDSELYKDAQKAHSFAKNDISIYLPKLKEHDSKFDINKFYKKIKADRATVTINGVETALGLKKIFSSILLK